MFACYHNLCSILITGANSVCDVTPLPHSIQLPSDCVQSETGLAFFDIGRCPIFQECGGEKQNQTECVDSEHYCCGEINHDQVQVQCSGYEIKLERVKECGCKSCSPRSATLTGTVVDHISSAIISHVGVYVNGKFETSTTSRGEFSVNLGRLSSHQRISVTFRDDTRNKYEDFVKVYTSTSDSDTFVDVIFMRSFPDPVMYESSSEMTLCIGRNETEPLAEIVIPQDSTYLQNGQKYNGNVMAYISQVDFRNSSDFLFTRGDFTAIDEIGEGQTLQTYGMFSVKFESENGVSLNVGGDVSMFVNEDVIPKSRKPKLWKLNEITGRWEEMADLYSESEPSRRKKRQRPGEIIYDGLGEYDYNFDSIAEDDICYAKIVPQVGGVVSIASQTQWDNGWLTRKEEYTWAVANGNDGICVKVGCLQQYSGTGMYGNSYDKLVTYISATTVNNEILSAENGLPNLPCSNIQYEWNSQGNVIKVRSTGPANECQLVFRKASDCMENVQTNNRFLFSKKADVSENIFYNYEMDNTLGGVSIFHPIANSPTGTRKCGDIRSVTEEYCFLKIHLALETNAPYVLLRTRSEEGSFDPIDLFRIQATDYDSFYGFRDTVHNAPFDGGIQRDKFICVEYKCTGSVIAQYRSLNHVEQELCKIGEGTTRVTITLKNPNQELMKCTVTNAQDVFKTELDQPIIEHSESTTTVFDVPKAENTLHGLYTSGNNGRIDAAEEPCKEANSAVAFTLTCTD